MCVRLYNELTGGFAGIDTGAKFEGTYMGYMNLYTLFNINYPIASKRTRPQVSR